MMQIITLDDIEFPELAKVWAQAREIGSFTRNGRVHRVRATQRLMMVSNAESPSKFALRPTHNLNDSVAHAFKLLEKEEQRGSDVEVCS